jgi:hypothetical protein
MAKNIKRVHFDGIDDDEAAAAGPSKRSADHQDEHYVPQEDCSGENLNMDPETAKRLFETGSTLILLDVPPTTEIGIDVQSWRSGAEFKGIKMIPSGLHFIYWSPVSKEGATGPRYYLLTGFSRIFF